MTYQKHSQFIGIIAVFAITLFGLESTAQLTVDADLRTRYEYRHGFSTLFPTDADAAQFIAQRSRIKARFVNENVEVFLSIQDIRTWGDVRQLNSGDRNGFALHEGWAKFNLTEGVAVKVGRQEIDLDDARMLGAVDWVMPGRSHDAAIVMVDTDLLQAQGAIAVNRDGASLTDFSQMTAGTYRSMQYLWLHKNFDKFKASVLVLNNGLQFVHDSLPELDEVRYSQTVGTHLSWGNKKLGVKANGYYQMGEDRTGNTIEAFLASLDVAMKGRKLNPGIGGEYISGNSTDGGDTNSAFSPLYGTNHKFNGIMDYFYVGNHGNGPGLIDLYARVNILLGGKAKLNVAFHNFSAAETFSEGTSTALGNEVDMVFVYPVNKEVIFKAGYSHMLPEEGMKVLKGTDNGETNNWGWLMLVIKPRIFDGAAAKAQAN